jgi:uncharacterized membrane protein
VSDRSLRLATAALALVGAGIAGYLVVERYTGGVISCTTGGCETVQSSRYSELAGIPVAVLGLVAYLTILTLAFVRSDAAQAALLAVALAGVAFSGYLLWAQVVPIGAFCDWCLASDAVMTAIAGLSLMRLLPVRFRAWQS